MIHIYSSSVLSIVFIVENMTDEALCSLCEEKHAATHKCLDCNTIMCEFMSVSHLKMKGSRHHLIEKLTTYKFKSNSGVNTKDAALGLFLCTLHNDVFKYYDHDCQSIICRDCYAFNHSGHRCTSICDAAFEFRELLEVTTQDIQDTVNKFQESEKGIVDAETQLDKRFLILNEAINKEFKEVTDNLQLHHP